MANSGLRASWQDLLDCLRSPCCGESLDLAATGVACQNCGTVYPEKGGILVLLKDQGKPKPENND